MITTGAADLLHLVGFLTGAVLYAMLLVMVAKSVARPDRLTLATAILGLTWNLGELTASAAQAAGLSTLAQWLAAASFSALGFLPAVVVHSVSRIPGARKWGPLATSVVVVGYLSAASSAVMQFASAAAGQLLPSSTGLLLITGGVAMSVIPLIALTQRQGSPARGLWLVALAVFAVSALHLGQFHGAQESWTVELLGHHASIPLAFAILYQDYRFALADLFLKQALTLVTLVAIVFGSYWIVEPLLRTGQGSPSPTAVSVLLALWVATALVVPHISRAITLLVDRVILGRRDYEVLAASLAVEVEQCDSVDAVLTCGCTRLAPALTAQAVTWTEAPEDRPSAPHEILVNTAEAPRPVLIVGPLAGGRRLLSDDFTMLQRVAMILARRIDALRLTEERYERMLHEREIRTLATESELRALRAQVNPHFLFNALTTIGYLIQSSPTKALQTLMRLTTLLRSVLRSEGEFTTLGRERELVDCYLQIEAARFEERLEIAIAIPEELWDIPIPSVIVQPLVENAIKHGIARSRSGGSIGVRAVLDEGGRLSITVRNTGAKFRGRRPGGEAGVGLRNVERRLQCYYGTEAMLTLREDQQGATVAELSLPVMSEEDRNVTLVPRGAAS
jgi:two-component system LytT family sensor kinase